MNDTDRLLETLNALRLIVARLEHSLEREGLHPFVAERVRHGSEEAIEAQDAFIQRFAQAADHVLRKLFPRTLAVLEVSDEALAFLDALDRLERIGLIDDAEQWSGVARLRNRLIHEYALSEQDLADDLNAAWSAAGLLTAQIKRIERHLHERGVSNAQG